MYDVVDGGATGGGISALFPVPSWQSGLSLPPSVFPSVPPGPGRGVPDIAGNASGYSGYSLIFEGSSFPPSGSNIPGTSGTSQVAPLYAGLIARINALIGHPVGYLNPILYGLKGSGVFREIADGANNSFDGGAGYTAGPGWNACTGLGVIDGSNLLSALQATYRQSFYFVVDQSSFGRDEVSNATSGGGSFSVANAFWLVLEGFSPEDLGKAMPVFSGDFANLASLTPHPAVVDLSAPWRLRIPCDVSLNAAALSAFPAAGQPPSYAPLVANITVGGVQLPAATTEFELVGGANPRFENLDPTNPQAEFWLSQDLRVFGAGVGETPMPGGPPFGYDPYASIQSLLGYLNGDTTLTVPRPVGAWDFLNGLPGQSGAETAESSVTPLTKKHQQIHNFAVARVRLQGPGGSQAQNVRVFFRLFVGQSTDTDFQPLTSYNSQLGASGDDAGKPVLPLPSGPAKDPSGESLITVPFFATNDPTGAQDYDGSHPNANIRTIQVPPLQDGVYAYFGCFLDMFKANGQSLFPGTHYCLVAEIAYDDAPIQNANGITMSPENCDKLAQRNFQIFRI
jgi:hypothetical protein